MANLAPGTSPNVALLAAALEIPDCGCTFRFHKACECEGECDCPRIPDPPCKHILGRKHNYSLEDWSELLTLAFPDEYSTPPSPPAKSNVLSRQGRVALYEEREFLGLSLYHPDDEFRDNTMALRVSVTSERAGERKRLRNGRPNPNETIVAGEFPRIYQPASEADESVAAKRIA